MYRFKGHANFRAQISFEKQGAWKKKKFHEWTHRPMANFFPSPVSVNPTCEAPLQIEKLLRSLKTIYIFHRILKPLEIFMYMINLYFYLPYPIRDPWLQRGRLVRRVLQCRYLALQHLHQPARFSNTNKARKSRL